MRGKNRKPGSARNPRMGFACRRKIQSWGSRKAKRFNGGRDSRSPLKEKTTICFWGKDSFRRKMDLFVLKLSLDTTTKSIRMRKIALFDHDSLHSSRAAKPREILTPFFSLKFTVGKKGKALAPIPLRGNSFASLGSALYSIGGGYHKRRHFGSDLVHYIDTNKHQQEGCCWTQGPSMLSPRYMPQVVTVDHKLYAFGCSGIDKCGHDPVCRVWAEVFDPKDGEQGRWRALPDPPPLLLQAGQFLVIPPTVNGGNQKKILVTTTSADAFEFDIETYCWTHTKCEFMKHWSQKGRDWQPVRVDNVLYWFDHVVHAFDIDRDICYAGPVQDLSLQTYMRIRDYRHGGVDYEHGAVDVDRPAVLHLGGRYFCLLSLMNGVDFFQDRFVPRIHCTVIKVSRTRYWYKHYETPDGVGDGKCERFLSVSVVSCQCFRMKVRWLYTEGRIMLT